MQTISPYRVTSRRTGLPKVPAPKIVAAFSCDVCGELLIWTGSSWCCPKALHSKAVPPQQMRIRLEKLLRKHYKRWTARGLERLYRRVSAYRSLLEEQEARRRRAAAVCNRAPE